MELNFRTKNHFGMSLVKVLLCPWITTTTKKLNIIIAHTINNLRKWL